MRTCEFAGFGARAEIDPDLAEWDYGEYEGRRTADILSERPDWQLFRDGAPGGESPDQIGARADRVVARIRAVGGKCSPVLERAYLAGPGRELARTAGRGRPVFLSQHR